MIVLPEIAKKVKKNSPINKNNEGYGIRQLSSDDGRTLDLINERSLRWVRIGYTTIQSGDISYDAMLGTYTAEISIDHGLGFAAVVYASFKNNSDTTYTPLPYTIQSFTGSGYEGFLGIHIFVDEKKIYFRLETYPGVTPIPIAPDPPYTIKYYISNIGFSLED